MAAVGDGFQGINPVVLNHPAVQRLLQSAPMDPVDYSAVDIPPVILDNQQQPAINYAKYLAKWNLHGLDVDPVVLPAAVGSTPQGGGAQMTIARPGVQGGDEEFLGFMSKEDQRFAVFPKSQSLNLEFCNNPMSNRLLLGKGFGGGVWDVPFYEPATGAILWNPSNLTNIQSNVRITGASRRFIGAEAQNTVQARRAKWLSTRMNPAFVGPDANPNTGESVEFTLPVGAGVQLTLNCSLFSVGDFLATSPVDDSSYADGSAGTPQFRVMIIDGVGGYSLMNNPMSVPDFVAACAMFAADPRLVPMAFSGPWGGLFTHLFTRDTQIILNFYNDDAKAIKVRFGFRGAMLRYPPAEGRSTNNSAEQRATLQAASQPNNFANIVTGGRS